MQESDQETGPLVLVGIDIICVAAQPQHYRGEADDMHIN